MQKTSTIPEGSNLRESADFKAVQDAWADALFDKALATSDVSEKRAVLDRIARATTVDQARRKRAADELDAIQRPAINVADLPSDTAAAAVTAPPSASAAAPAHTATPMATHTATQAPLVAAAPPVVHKEPTTKPPAPKPAATQKPVASKKDKNSSTLVRDNPFE
jgi:hypothetical protein